jgi:hypothetical protein
VRFCQGASADGPTPLQPPQLSNVLRDIEDNDPDDSLTDEENQTLNDKAIKEPNTLGLVHQDVGARNKV